MTGHVPKWCADHANYRKLLDLLEAQTALFADGEPNYDLMSDVLYYLTQYPDRFHHRREDVAFRALLDRDPDSRDVVEKLFGQHEALAQSGAKLVEDLRAAADGTMMSRATIQADVDEYAAFRRGHMDIEEREVFPRLATALGETDWFLIDSTIHFDDDPLFGPTVQARFSALHRQIAAQAGCGCTEPVEPPCCSE